MNVELKGFQALAVERLALRCRLAANEVQLSGPQAIVLSAPTASGKTVMATAVMEALVDGDETAEGDPEVTFLWITDQPELNEQTRRRVLNMSSVFTAERLETIDAGFDEELFAPGRLYFLNTQKLREGSLLVAGGDRRDHTIWETIANTVDARSRSFWVLLDEDHKGMLESPLERQRAQTIVQKFIKGSDEIPAIPLVLGISATPARFHTLLAGTNRTTRVEDIPPEEVRASGLLKETILVFHPDETQPADMTLLEQAAGRLQDYERRWARYQDQAATTDPVRPILVVQVEDAGGGTKLSRTDLGTALAVVEGILGPLEAEQVAHAFQEAAAIEVGERKLRYCPPADIDADSDLRVVLFKTSLNTGWDCPRAEVMMSFRKALDHTLIAQLVGRMVRNPLARRVDSDEYLNTVSLYLPHYDREGLDRVLEHLQRPDPGTSPAVRVERGEKHISLQRAPELGACFAALETIPTYTVAAVRKTTNVRRLMKLARLLANDGILPNALELARALVLETLEARREVLEGTEAFQAIVKESGEIDLRAVEFSYATGGIRESTASVPVSPENVEDLFRAAGRKLAEGLHKTYWKARAEADRASIQLAKLELFALVHDERTMRKLEAVAGEQIKVWQTAHKAAINGLPPDRQDGYHEVRRTATRPEAHEMVLPETIEGTKATRGWAGHLYVDDAGGFPYDFRSSWEPKVIEAEQAREDSVGFLRNEDRKKWALCVPYRLGGETKPFYPDFVFFRELPDGSVAVDILDPHSPSLEDWWQKAVGLADYAAEHGHHFGRIEFIIVAGDLLRRLDVNDEDVRRRVREVKNNDHLRQLIETSAS